MKTRNLVAAVIGAALLSAAPVSLHWSSGNGVAVSVGNADARVGRPLTPVSVAGVHRRAHRRAYYGAYADPY